MAVTLCLAAPLNSKLVLTCWFIIRNLFYDLRSWPTLKRSSFQFVNILLLLTSALVIVIFLAFLAFWINDLEGFHRNGFSMCVLTISKDDSVSSALSELLLGILFLFINEKILSSLAFEWGIVMMHQATFASKSKFLIITTRGLQGCKIRPKVINAIYIIFIL